MNRTTAYQKRQAKARPRDRQTASERLARDRSQAQRAKGRLTMEEIIFSLKHYWRFVDCEALELTVLSQGMDENAA